MKFVFCRWCPAVWGLILTVFLGFWSQQISAQLSVVPIPKTPAVGENVLLSVSGVTGDIRFFSWYRGDSTERNQILFYLPTIIPPEETFPPYEGRVRAFPNGSMEISGVTTNDSGSYTVQIQANEQQVATVNIIVYEILGKPSITASLIHPMEHKDSVTLTCVTSSAVQTILWSKDSQKLPSDDRMSLSHNNRSLTISNVSSADSGNYQCEIINPVSRSTRDPYTLTVYSSEGKKRRVV